MCLADQQQAPWHADLHGLTMLSPNDVLLGRACRTNTLAPEPEALDDVSFALTHMERVARAFFQAMAVDALADEVKDFQAVASGGDGGLGGGGGC